LPRPDADPTAVPASDVFSCAAVLGRHYDEEGADWALVRLDRPASPRRPLATRTSGEAAAGEPLFVIGHPSGLPTKIAGGAAVRDASARDFFTANLDTYGGNSGSAVFGARTGLVEGILARGEDDFAARGDCRVSKRCPDDGCRGEAVTRISAARLQNDLGLLGLLRYH
jgi:hypothetical protein